MINDILRRAVDATLGFVHYALQTSIAGQVVKMPSGFATNFVDFHAEGKDVYIRFGTSSSMDVPDPAATSTYVDANTDLVEADGSCYLIPADNCISVRVPAGATHFAHFSGDATGILRFTNTTGAGEDQSA